jgi:hypothetical protein
LQTPPGSSGKADVFVSTPSGSTTSSRSFQFLPSVQSYFETCSLQVPVIRSETAASLFNEHRSHRYFRSSTEYISRPPPASRWPSSKCRIAWAGADSRWFAARRRRFRHSKCLSSRSGKGNWHDRACRRSSRLHQLWSRAGRCHKHANCLRRSQRRRRFFWLLSHMPRSDEPDGEPANHSAGSATGSHQPHWRTACSGHRRGRSRFCWLWRRSGGPVAVWSASAPNQFVTSVANASNTDS